MEWVGIIFRELKCVDFVNGGRHSCILLGEVIKGCIALRSVDTFVFALFNNFDHLVVLRLLQFKVGTREFSGNIRVSNIRFNKSLVLLKVIIVPVILLLFAVEKFKGLCLVFLLVVYAPIVNNFDDPIRHGKGSDQTGFFNNTHVDVEYLVCALAIASGTIEYARERAKAHGVGYSGVIVGFNVGFEGGLAVFCEIEFTVEDNFAGGVYAGYPGGHWEAIKPKDSKVKKVDDKLTGEHCEGEVRHKCTAVFLGGADVLFDFAAVFACRRGVDFHHFIDIFNPVELLVHHIDTDDKASTSI
jgi:hypothetical protein